MAKKVFFGKINQETINNLNKLSEVIFVSAHEGRRLSEEKKKATSNRDKAVEDGTKTAEHDNAIRAITYKQKALSSLRRNTLFDHKDEADNAVDGLFSIMGINNALYEAYILMQNEGKRGEYLKAIKGVLSAMGMDCTENLTSALANTLTTAVGRVKTSRNAELKGEFTKDATRVAFCELFARRLLEQVAKTCDKVTVYKAEFYTVNVVYDQNMKIETYTITEKTAE